MSTTSPPGPLPLPELLAHFQANTGQREPEALGARFRGLILPGSLQAETAALLIAHFQPERVGLLITERTQDFPDKAAARLAELPHALAQSLPARPSWDCPPEDHATTIAVYRGIKELYLRWVREHGLQPAEIAVDVTGGLKPMSVGLEKAAQILGLTTLYVQSQYRFRDGRSEVEPGSQWLVVPPNPYTILGDLKAREGERLFNEHDYAGATRMFQELAANVPPDTSLDFRALAALSAAYAAWENFDVEVALTYFDSLAKLADSPRLAQAQGRLGVQGAIVRRLATDAAALRERPNLSLTFLADLDHVLPLLGALYANAQRRTAQERFDIAAQLRYRCLELLEQHRLARHGVLSESPSFRVLRQGDPSLEQRYHETQRSLGRRRSYDLPDRPFGLMVGYMLLVTLDDELVRGYDILRIERRSKARNTSVLNHGFRPITKHEHDPFAEVLEELLDRFFALNGRDRAAWEASVTFVPLE